MGVKWIFGMLAVAVLAQLLARWVSTLQVGRGGRHITPAEILRLRLVNGEIDRCEYEIRIRKLHRIIAAALAKEKEPDRKGEQS